VASAIRIVLNALNNTRNAILVALEVDDTILLTRTTADVARGDAAGVIASTCTRVARTCR